MDIRVSLDGAAGMLLLSLPWLLLAVAAWRASYPAGRTDRGQTRPVAANAPSERVVAAGLADAAAPDRDETTLGIMAMASSGMAGATESGYLPDAAPPPGLSLQEQEDALVSSVAAAKADRDDVALSRDSVRLARILIARSAHAEAAALLQSAALVARRAKLPVVHAEARIELADLAQSEGDMTSACEHWQMAKLMFHESGRRADQDRMADMMRQNRCPTDWILTNF
jgi:hypothetical protein